MTKRKSKRKQHYRCPACDLNTWMTEQRFEAFPACALCKTVNLEPHPEPRPVPK